MNKVKELFYGFNLPQCADAKSNKSLEDWVLQGVVEHGLEVPNLNCTKSYKIRNTITNFQKLNIKNEVYLTLKHKSLYGLYSIVKVGF